MMLKATKRNKTLSPRSGGAQAGKYRHASVGALMMHFMLETILAAHLLGVNPFDQPAVETGKRLARERLGAMSRK